MTISISYDSWAGSVSLNDYLIDWALGFTFTGPGVTNTGLFSNGRFSGDQYATQGAHGGDYAMIAGSDTSQGLHYVFHARLDPNSNLNHYLWGKLDNVQLGQELGGGRGSDFTLDTYKVEFNGLDLSSAEGAGRAGNVVHEVIYGLMQGKTTALANVLNNLLDDFGLSTASTFDELAAAGIGHSVDAYGSGVALVGVQEVAQDWAQAA